MKGSQKLSLSKTLAEEGLVQGEPTSLSYAYEAACLQEAWRCIQKCPVDDDESMALEGIRQLRGLQETTPLRNLVNLKHLALGNDFNESLEGVAWPSGLQSLSFGCSDFNQSLERVAWPSGLQSLSFGKGFNQSLEGVTWPSGLQSISFFSGFAALKRVNWPSSLQLQCLKVKRLRSEVKDMDLPRGLERFECTLETETRDGLCSLQEWMIQME